MSNKNPFYTTSCLFLNPWLKPIPNFHHVFKQGNVVIQRSTNSDGYSNGLSFRKDMRIKVYAKESWKENSPEVFLAYIDSYNDIEKKEVGSIEDISITIEVPYLNFEVKTVPNKQNGTGYKRKTHKVKSGENLSLIASKYKTSVNNLMKINPKIKNKDLIRAGEIIKIPQGD